MKTKKSNLIVAILIAVIGVILAGVLIAWMTGMFKDKKKELNSGTDKINHSYGSLADFDVQVYDGATINGESVVELIEEAVDEDEELSIAVRTLANKNREIPITIYYNRALTGTNAINSGGIVTTLNNVVSSDNYITPSAYFIGEVLRNINDEVTGILFVQKK